MTAWVLLPEALVLAGAAWTVLAGAPRSRRRSQTPAEDLDLRLPTLVTALLLIALILEVWLGGGVGRLFGGGFVQDRFALLAKAAMIVALILAVAGTEWEEESSWLVLPMLLLAGLGGMVVASATSLLGVWAGFQLSATAAAVAVATRDRELGLRLLLAAGLSGSLLALGFGYLYAAAGVAGLAELRQALSGRTTLPLAVATLVSLAGLALGLLPALLLPPARQAYRIASPLGVAALGGVAAAAAAVALIKLGAALLGIEQGWTPFLALVAALAMLLGAVGSLSAGSPRSLMAGLTVAQAGWLAAGLAAHDRAGLAGAAYLLAGFVVAAVAAPVLAGPAEAGFNGLRNLADRQPARAVGLGLALLSMAGVPPLAGFFGEFTVGVGMAAGQLAWLLAIGLLSGIICTVACVRAVRLIFLEVVDEQPRRRQVLEFGSAADALRFGAGLAAAFLIAAYGVFANPIHGLAVQGAAALGLR
jgi:NADH-quinone oxidoreductase subunit N